MYQPVPHTQPLSPQSTTVATTPITHSSTPQMVQITTMYLRTVLKSRLTVVLQQCLTKAVNMIHPRLALCAVLWSAVAQGAFLMQC